MNASRNFLFMLTGVLAVFLMLGTLRLTARIFRKINEVPYKESSSYLVWLGNTVVMLAAAFIPAIVVIVEASDLIYGMTAINTPAGLKDAFTLALKTTGIALLLACIWFWFWHILTRHLAAAVIGKADITTEMELNNSNFFFSRGLITILCMLVLIPLYLSLLRYFIPAAPMPFYR